MLSVIMLSVIDAECYYAESRHAESCGILKSFMIQATDVIVTKHLFRVIIKLFTLSLPIRTYICLTACLWEVIFSLV